MLEEAFEAYSAGHADGEAGHRDHRLAGHSETGTDYRVGVADGSLAAFQATLIAEVRRVLDEPR